MSTADSRGANKRPAPSLKYPGVIVGGMSARISNGLDKITPSDCYHAPPPGSGGLLDLSVMTPPFAPAGASAWSIAF